MLRRSSTILAPRAARLRRALNELMTWAADQPVDIVRPDGGAVCCVRLRSDVFADTAVRAFYGHLADEGVRVAPGSWFGADDRTFRLGFGHLDPDAFTEALARLCCG